MEDPATPNAPATIPTIPLTRASVFWLITTLILAGVYQPACGSLVLGPTSRFWRCSPLSTGIELWVINRRFLEALPRLIRYAFSAAIHPDATLVETRKFYSGETGKEDEIEGRELDAVVADVNDPEVEDEVGLGDAPCQDVSDDGCHRPTAYDPEAASLQLGFFARVLTRIRIFLFLFWGALTTLAYCIIISRAMNAPNGSQMYHDLFDTRTKTGRYRFYQRTLEEINEDWRFRLGICLPVLAQFVKVMVVQGVTLPKALAIIYFAHWLVLEIQLTLATNCVLNPIALTQHVNAHLSESYQIYEMVESAKVERSQPDVVDDQNEYVSTVQATDEISEADSDDTLAEIHAEVQRWPFDQRENVLMYLHLGVAIVLLHLLTAMGLPDQGWIRGLLTAALLLIGLFPLYSTRYVSVRGRQQQPWSGKHVKSVNKPYSRRKNDPTFGGYVVGGDLGVASLVLWTLWCIIFYNSEGTDRPSWPWLDFLG
jgi:hypothetical protein